jgi:enoyl-CoA hydratase/carnithine racemase
MPPAPAPRPPEGDWLGTPFLEFERRGAVAVCTVNRPERRNAMTAAMYFGVRYAVDLVNADDELSGLLITGTGDVFIPGGDLGPDQPDAWADLARLLGMDNTPFDAIRRSAKPVMCAVNGLAQGGGMMIAMLADVTVASERATFRSPELFRGIADTHYGQILPRQVGPARARDLLLTGRTLSASEALDWGLVARMCPHDELMTVAEDVLAWCCRTAPQARRQVKRVMDEFYGAYDRASMDDSLGSEESMEGYRAFAERRSPTWVPDTLRLEGRL